MGEEKLVNTLLNKLAWLAMLSSFCVAAFGQTSGAGTITGSVKDPSGSTVPGAIVILRNTDTSVERSLEMNEVGLYVAPFVPPGHYEVSATKTGFAKRCGPD